MKNDSLKMYVLLFGILCLGLLSAYVCYGQTNTPPPLPSYPDSTPQDIERVLNDFGIHVNVTSIGSILFLVYIGAKFVRNKTPLGQGAIGKILSSVVNLESKPTTPPQPQQPPKP